MSNVFALRDALQGLAGDKGAHVATVAAELSRAVAMLVQHGNINPLTTAAEFMATVKGKSKAALSLLDAWRAAVGAVPFVTLTGDEAKDTRPKGGKRGTATEAETLADAAAEAFTLAYGTRWNAPKATKPKAKAPKAPAADEGEGTDEGTSSAGAMVADSTVADTGAAVAALLGADDAELSALLATDDGAALLSRLSALSGAAAAAAGAAVAAAAAGAAAAAVGAAAAVATAS